MVNIEVVYIFFNSAAKLQLFCDIFVVLVGPFCPRVCAFRKIIVLLQRFRASVHAQKKCELLFCILGNSGFDSYRLQYKQKVHTYVRTLAISRKSITICRRLNYSSIKLMFIMIHTCINIFYSKRFKSICPPV